MNSNKKICVITGCNTGIGKATAIGIAKLNYRVVMLVRDSDKSRAALEEVRTKSGNEGVQMHFVDLSSRQSIIDTAKALQKELESVDVLINNAGVVKRKLQMTLDNEEMTLAVNFLAPFLLTNLLLPLIEKSESGRIVNLTSALYTRGQIKFEQSAPSKKFDGNKAYANSKLLVVVFTRELAKRLEAKGITVNCIHPGVAGTEAFREYPKWFNALLNLFISKPETVAEPVIRLASDEQLKKTTGQYFYKESIKKTIDSASDEEMQLKVWEYAENVTDMSTAINALKVE